MNFWNSDRAQKIAQRENVDAFIATSMSNVAYATGFWSPPLYCFVEEAFAVIPVDNPGIRGLVCFVAGWDQIVDLGLEDIDVIPYGKFYYHRKDDVQIDKQDLRIFNETSNASDLSEIEALIALVKKYNLDNKSIAIDEKGITLSQFDVLKAALPDAKWKMGHSLLREIRTIKRPEEVERIRAVAEITENAVHKALEIAEEGITELDMARVLTKEMAQNDAVPVLICIGFGTKSAHPNSLPTTRELQRGNIIRFDVGARRLLYHSDLARIATFGEPSEKIVRYYNALLAGQEAAINLVKAGTVVSDVFKAAMDAAHSEGLPHYQRHHIGHGIGADLYDEPLITRDSDIQLESGMVINIETPYYELGFGGLQTEDAVLVKEDGCEFLTSGNRPLYRA